MRPTSRLRSRIRPTRRRSWASGNSWTWIGTKRTRPGTLSGAAGGNSADLLGPTVRIPEGTVASGTAEFFGTFQGGVPFRGRFFNLIGRGHSQLDGFGFVNAEAAVKAVSKGE